MPSFGKNDPLSSIPNLTNAHLDDGTLCMTLVMMPLVSQELSKYERDTYPFYHSDTNRFVIVLRKNDLDTGVYIRTLGMANGQCYANQSLHVVPFPSMASVLRNDDCQTE